jgi:hypothetical protein
MRIGVALAVFLQLFTAPIASALTTDVTLLSEDFASYDGVDANAPAGWTFANIGHYTTETSSGVAPNALQFNSSSSVATVMYTLDANQTSKALSFWVKGNGTGTSGSTLTVSESSNGTSWTPAAAYTGADIPSAGATIVANLLPTTTSVQLAYTKVTGNLAIDDAVITGQEVDEAPTKPDASPPAGTYNTEKSVTLSSSDDSGLAPEIRYTTDESTPSQTTSNLYTTPILVNVDMTIKAIAYDVTGNASEMATFSYVIDTTLPTIDSISYSNNDAPTNGKVKVTVIASEPIKTPDGWAPGENDKTVTKEYVSNTTEFLKVEDLAGNESAEEREINVKGIDTTPPTININGITEDGVSYTSAVTYTASDKVAVSTVTINDAPASHSGSITSSGTYTITVTDTAGNPYIVTIEVAIPVVMPTLSVSPPKALETLSSRNLVSTPNLGVTGIAPSTTDSETPRVDIAQANNPDLKKSSPQKDIALAPSGEGWKLWGIAWYWYGTVAGLLGSGGWLLGRRYFTVDNEEF